MQKEETMKDNFNEEINDRLENIEDSIGNIEENRSISILGKSCLELYNELFISK